MFSAQVIKRYILHAKKTAFIVEHDFIMATYLADRVVVYEGQPSMKARALAYVGRGRGGCLRLLRWFGSFGVGVVVVS